MAEEASNHDLVLTNINSVEIRAIGIHHILSRSGVMEKRGKGVQNFLKVQFKMQRMKGIIFLTTRR